MEKKTINIKLYKPNCNDNKLLINKITMNIIINMVMYNSFKFIKL